MRKAALPLVFLALPVTSFGQSGDAAGAMAAGSVVVFAAIASVIIGLIWLVFPFIVMSKLSSIRLEIEAGNAAASSRAKQETADLTQRHSQLIAALDRVAKAASSSGVTYYLSRDGSTDGPHSETTLRSMYDSGLITDETPAMRQGDQSWSTVGGLIQG